MKGLKKFIEDNYLDFTGTGSDLNGNCVILAGYVLYITNDEDDFEKLIKYLNKYCDIRLSTKAEIELQRVYDFAYTNNYAKWWEEETNRALYKL